MLVVSVLWSSASTATTGQEVPYRPTGYHMYRATKIALEDIAGHLSVEGWSHDWISDPNLVVDEGDGRYVVARGSHNLSGVMSAASAIVFEITTRTDCQLQFVQTAWVCKN